MKNNIIRNLEKKNSAKGLKRKKALKRDVNELIDRHGVYELEDNLPLYYGVINEIGTDSLLQACKEIKYNNTPRTNGLVTNAKPFGSKPANGRKDPFCSQAVMKARFPKADSVFKAFSHYMASIYKEKFPEIYLKNKKALRKDKKPVHEDYIIGNTPYTSGIVNFNNNLAYHYDTGNHEGMLSGMIVLSNNISGGHLILPEYDVAFKIKNNTVIFFDGQKILHGVSPIHVINSRGYRYSIVYYSMKELWRCLPFQEEMDAYNQYLENDKRRVVKR